MNQLKELQCKLSVILPLLDERSKRLVAANEALNLGYGGVSKVNRASGISRKSISKGIAELSEAHQLPQGRIRRSGGGRKSIIVCDPKILDALADLIEPETRGDPESPLRWTCKSTRSVADQLTKDGHVVSHVKVAQILHTQGYSLQGNRKTEEGTNHPDRDAQFCHINKQVSAALKSKSPVVSVDTKKKEIVGNYENDGRQWLPSKKPKHVNGHDFPDPDIPRAFPYGVYDLGRNTGFVNIGTDHDTGAFAVASIRGWWKFEGRSLYSNARELLITADAGGSNGHRLKLWKVELQKFANESGLAIRVCHFPPGTSKWNKVEHRLFSFISSNWRGEPLRDYETIINLISNTRTAKGLKVSCRLDRRKYPVGQKISDEAMKDIQIVRDSFHGDWNYMINPVT
jgi:hypothetical protein